MPTAWAGRRDLTFGSCTFAGGRAVRKDRERVTRALDCLSTGWRLTSNGTGDVYHDQWRDVAQQSFRDDRGTGKAGPDMRWDAHSLLTVMWDQWNRVFRGRLDHAERSLVSELREYRNRWAHQVDFNFDDTYRILDSAERLAESGPGGRVGDRLPREERSCSGRTSATKPARLIARPRSIAASGTI